MRKQNLVDKYGSKLCMFIPAGGICYSCDTNILEDNSAALDKILSRLRKDEIITGCPVCHRSYCE